MKAQIIITLDIPDKYLFDNEYAESSLQQFAWDHTVHELTTNCLVKTLETMSDLNEAEQENNAMKIALRKANLSFYKDLNEMFKNCQYEIKRLTA